MAPNIRVKFLVGIGRTSEHRSRCYGPFSRSALRPENPFAESAAAWPMIGVKAKDLAVGRYPPPARVRHRIGAQGRLMSLTLFPTLIFPRNPSLRQKEGFVHEGIVFL